MLNAAKRRIQRDAWAQMVAQLRYYLRIDPREYTINELVEMHAGLQWARSEEAKEKKGRP